MPVKKGRLKPEDVHKISVNYQFLKDNFDPKNGAMDYLITMLVFELHDRDFVENGGEKTARGRVERFVETLNNSGQDAYQHFIAGLKENGDDHIARKLEETVVPPVEMRDPLAWIDELPELAKNQPPTEKEASSLSSKFGIGWEHVFFELDISKAKVEQAKMNNPHNVSVAIMNLIIQWRQKNGSQARLILLLNAMRKAEERCTIQWKEVKEVVRKRLEGT